MLHQCSKQQINNIVLFNPSADYQFDFLQDHLVQIKDKVHQCDSSDGLKEFEVKIVWVVFLVEEWKTMWMDVLLIEAVLRWCS